MIALNDFYNGEGLPENPIRFAPGTLVCHVRYGYRGVVVCGDGHCRADSQWYHSNKTQPSRDQPWYHVLVHNSAACTYAAQENLMHDPCTDPIRHPLLELFFSDFIDGAYIRNDTPWPGTEDEA